MAVAAGAETAVVVALVELTSITSAEILGRRASTALLQSKMESLGATEAPIVWVIIGVLLTGATATPLIGRLSDIRDKKSILLAVLAIVATGTAVSGLSNSILMLTCGQLLRGVGLAVVPLAFGIIRDTR